MNTTAEQVFGKLDEFMTEKTTYLEKGFFLTTKGAALMVARFLGVGVRLKAVATNCILEH